MSSAAVASTPVTKRPKIECNVKGLDYVCEKNGSVTTWTVRQTGSITPILQKVVNRSPDGVFQQAPHHTTLYAMGEVVLSTTLHMKVCVHFENKEKLEQAFSIIAGVLHVPEITQSVWKGFIADANAHEISNLYYNFFVNRVSCPESCLYEPFN